MLFGGPEVYISLIFNPRFDDSMERLSSYTMSPSSESATSSSTFAPTTSISVNPSGRRIV